MGKRLSFREMLAEEAEKTAAAIPAKSIIEIVEDGRVLIENHFGVVAYSQECISVKVKYGCVHICGHRLEIMRMTKDQLVIFGRISQIMLQRGTRA